VRRTNGWAVELIPAFTADYGPGRGRGRPSGKRNRRLHSPGRSPGIGQVVYAAFTGYKIFTGRSIATAPVRFSSWQNATRPAAAWLFRTANIGLFGGGLHVCSTKTTCCERHSQPVPSALRSRRIRSRGTGARCVSRRRATELRRRRHSNGAGRRTPYLSRLHGVDSTHAATSLRYRARSSSQARSLTLCGIVRPCPEYRNSLPADMDVLDEAYPKQANVVERASRRTAMKFGPFSAASVPILTGLRGKRTKFGFAARQGRRW